MDNVHNSIAYILDGLCTFWMKFMSNDLRLPFEWFDQNRTFVHPYYSASTLHSWNSHCSKDRHVYVPRLNVADNPVTDPLPLLRLKFRRQDSMLTMLGLYDHEISLLRVVWKEWFMSFLLSLAGINVRDGGSSSTPLDQLVHVSYQCC
jgi:hypothetical protein